MTTDDSLAGSFKTDGKACLVISLERYENRWQATRENILDAGLRPIRLIACDAQEMNDNTLYARYDASRNKSSYFAPLKRTEIACFLRHRKVWQEVADRNIPLVICEDDVDASHTLPEFLKALNETFSGYQNVSVKLYSKGRCPGSVYNGWSGPDQLLQPNVVPLGAVAYWLTPTAARQFLAASETIFEPVDVFLQQSWRHQVVHYVAAPSFVREVSDVLGGTTQRNDRKTTFPNRLLREVRRPIYRFQLALKSRKWSWERRKFG